MSPVPPASAQPGPAPILVAADGPSGASRGEG